MILYGIGNCDTVRKARAWLDARGTAHDFHDYKSAGIDAARLRAWADELGWERLLNRAGSTFRKLPDADKQGLDSRKAIALMLAQPSMIRRPLLDLGDRRLLGFDEAAWAAALAERIGRLRIDFRADAGVHVRKDGRDADSKAGARPASDDPALALRDGEARFRALADSAPAPVWLTDENGIEFVNRATIDFFGLTRRIGVGKRRRSR